MKRNPLLILTTTFLSLTLGATFAKADRSWNNANDPRNLEKDYHYTFSTLPLFGDLGQSHKGWSDSYWPATRGYIADRWQLSKKPGDFKKYKLLTKNQVLRMNPDQLKLLSPAEKFDILRNDFEYPTATYFRKMNPSEKDWWKGLCNGWTQASIHYDEPMPINFTSPINGITIPLGSSDIKGLLAYYYAYMDPATTPEDLVESKDKKQKENPFEGYVGRRCGIKSRLTFGLDGACDDLHPAAMHIVMTNEIGLRHNAIAMDRDPTPQVWNQPFIGYDAKVLEVKDYGLAKNKTDGTRREVKMEMKVFYVNELYDTLDEALSDDEHSDPRWAPLGKGNSPIGTKTYRYILELDSRDRIIGGEWAYDTESFPDFIWRQNFNPNGLATDTANYKDNWTLLSKIVEQSTAYAK
jgi:hypothetical protein